MFNTDLVSEYQALVEHLGFSASELEHLSLNALRASFLPAHRKAELEEAFLSQFALLEARHLDRKESH
jgi:adenosine deaminase